jgi:integrase
VALRQRHKPGCAAHPSGGKRGARCTKNCPWQARIPDPTRPGTTHKVERTFRTKREAEAWEHAQHADKQRGEWVDPRKAERRFSEVVVAWQQAWPNRLSNGTQALYTGILTTHINPTFADVPIGRIDRGAVQRFVNELTAAGLASGTVRNAYACLRNALNTAVRYGWIRSNPCTNIDLPRAARGEMLFLTADEVRRVAEAIDKHYRVLIYTAAYTGLRAGELLALRRCDVDLLRGVVHVRRALKDINGVLEFGDVKTAGSRRTVTLPASIRALLTEHLSSDLSGGNGPEALVFPSKTGKPIRHRLFVRRHFRPTVAGWTDDAGVEHPGVLPDKAGLRFHDLRHTAASLAIHAGAHPLLVSKMLGHSNVEITLNRYAHLFPDVAEALAEKLDALFVAAETGKPSSSSVHRLRQEAGS